MSLVTNVSSQFVRCPRERGVYYASSPDCLFYYRCENRFFRVQVCFPWQRFDIHTLRCKKRFEVDCNPMYAGIWRPMFDNPGLVEEEIGAESLESGGEPLDKVTEQNPSELANAELAGKSPLFGQPISEEPEVAGPEGKEILEGRSPDGGKPSKEVPLKTSAGEGIENTEPAGDRSLTGQRLTEESGIAGNEEARTVEGSLEEGGEPIQENTAGNSDLIGGSQEIPNKSKIPREEEIWTEDRSSVEPPKERSEQINGVRQVDNSTKVVVNGEKAGERPLSREKPEEMEMSEQEQEEKTGGILEHAATEDLLIDNPEVKSPVFKEMPVAQEPAVNGRSSATEQPAMGIENPTSSKQENPEPVKSLLNEPVDRNPVAAQENDSKSTVEKSAIGSMILEAPLDKSIIGNTKSEIENSDINDNKSSETVQLEPENDIPTKKDTSENVNSIENKEINTSKESTNHSLSAIPAKQSNDQILRNQHLNKQQIPPTTESLLKENENKKPIKEKERANSNSTMEGSPERIELQNPEPVKSLINEPVDRNPVAAEENDSKSTMEKSTIRSMILEAPLDKNIIGNTKPEIENSDINDNKISQTAQLEPEKDMPTKKDTSENVNPIENKEINRSKESKNHSLSAIPIKQSSDQILRNEHLNKQQIPPTTESLLKENENKKPTKEKEIANSNSTMEGSPERIELQNLTKDSSTPEVPATVTEVERPTDNSIKFEVESPILEEASKSKSSGGEIFLQTQSKIGDKKVSLMSHSNTEQNNSLPRDFSKSEIPVGIIEFGKLLTTVKSVEDKESSSDKNLQEINSTTKKRSACSDGNEFLVFPEPESNISQNLTDENQLPFRVPISQTDRPNTEEPSSSSSQDINSGQPLVNLPAKAGTSGQIWYWCGSGRFVLAQNSEEGDSICLQLRDPESIDEEGKVQPGGDWAGHSFLGTNNEFD